jgi:hypothetical protein
LSKVIWWIFDSTRGWGEIESPDLQVEVWVRPQEVSSFDMVIVFFALDMSSNLTCYSNYTTLLRMYPLHCLRCEVDVKTQILV